MVCMRLDFELEEGLRLLRTLLSLDTAKGP